MTNPPTMQRSRGQLATSYAPHSLFTFEGGSGACMALSASGNRNAELRAITQRMIGEQIQEYFEAWGRPRHARSKPCAIRFRRPSQWTIAC